MASDGIPKQEFFVRNIQTRSVTLYPTKAQVIRDIKDVSLKPGPNQIIVEGFTPTIDEHSIKVDGTGAATITDLSIQLVPNREIFEDIYPSDDSDNDDSDSEDDETDKEEEATRLVTAEINELSRALKHELEMVASASDRSLLLANYVSSIEASRPENLEDCLKDYRAERAKIFEDHITSQTKSENLRKRIRSLEKKKASLGKAARKAQAKLQAAKLKSLAKKNRKLQEVAQEKKRIRDERINFWPKKVYKLIISLDVPSGSTPAQSRRGSMDSLVKVATPSDVTEAVPKSGDVSLLISYITYSASWSPRYDLSLNTVANSGVLDYCAELKNTTSETWRDTKVVLSTSQTTYQGLEDTIPIMQPWHVRLMKNAGNGAALYSHYEQSQKSKNRQVVQAQMLAPRNDLFGLDQPPASNSSRAQRLQMQYSQNMQEMQVQPTQLMNQMQPMQQMQSVPQRLPIQDRVQQMPPPGSRGRLGSIQNCESVERTMAGSLMSSSIPTKKSLFKSRWVRRSGSADDSEECEEEDGATLALADPALAFEESSFEESGLTTTYDLPTLKTIAPMSNTTKHKIARVEFKSVIFSHILVPKLKPSAFLKARLRNASKITLLKGTAGLTVDGSFLGQSTIPRCSAGDSFTLPLGVDPTISVNYAKPTVRRSQSGIFSKEECEVFTRTATIANTKHNAAVELQVLDQVPVSEDERLRIEIVNPRGLKVGGDPVPTGMTAHTESSAAGTTKDGNSNTKSAASNARMSIYGDDGGKASGSGKEGARWGFATATAKKGGEINWNVKINPLKSCKLVLEYEAAYPGGETVIALD